MKCNEIFGTYEIEPCEHHEQVKIVFKKCSNVFYYKSMNRTSFVVKYLKLHACMHIIAKMHLYISLLVTCIIITCWTLLKVTEEKSKINSFLGSIFCISTCIIHRFDFSVVFSLTI